MKKSKEYWIYTIIAMSGILLVLLSLVIKCDDISSTLSGLGTGAISSLIVSYLFNIAVDRNQKIERQIKKDIVFKNLIQTAIDLYRNIIIQINEYIIFELKEYPSVFEVYKNNSIFINFCKKIENIEYDNISLENRNAINELLTINPYRLDLFASELKNLSKFSYYIQGILNENDLKNLFSDFHIDKFFEYVNKYKKTNKDFKESIQLFRITLLLITKVVNTFDECKFKISSVEEDIKHYMNQLYFDEVYCKSDEYIEIEISRAENEQAYYEEHPELLEELAAQYEKWENETPTDIVIEDMECLFSGLSSFSFEDLLKRADKNDSKLIEYFKRKDVKKIIKKHKYKKAIIDIYGRDYFKMIKQSGGIINGQT